MPKVVTQRCLEQDLNPRPTDRKPKCLSVAPPRQYVLTQKYKRNCHGQHATGYKALTSTHQQTHKQHNIAFIGPAQGRRLSWPGWLGEVLRWFAGPKTINHPVLGQPRRPGIELATIEYSSNHWTCEPPIEPTLPGSQLSELSSVVNCRVFVDNGVNCIRGYSGCTQAVNTALTACVQSVEKVICPWQSAAMYAFRPDAA